MYPNKLQFVIQLPLKLRSAIKRCTNRTTNQETSELKDIILKNCQCARKNHQANQSIDLLVQHEKNSVKNCHYATKTKKERKK